jgi:primase-like protein/bifunctional DNA primase/polymerase-like protein
MTPLEYARRGWCVVPIPCGQKKPAITGWQNFSAAIDDIPRLFRDGQNIAVRLGPRSGDLVDVDLDCPEALDLADLYLPATRAEFGRLSKPRSHRLYGAPGAVFETFADPVSGEMLVELRTDGREGGAHLSLLPPSIADGQRREWCGDVISPRVIDARALRLAIVQLAIGCLVARYISPTAARQPNPTLPGPDLPRMLWEFDHELGRAAYRWLGQPDPDAPRRYPRPRNELSRRDIDLAEVVHAISNNCDWETWNRTGMAIFAASKGSGDGFIVFDDFSAKSPKYDSRAVEERWRNYRRSPPSRISTGSLVHMARQNGWRPQAKAG